MEQFGDIFKDKLLQWTIIQNMEILPFVPVIKQIAGKNL